MPTSTTDPGAGLTCLVFADAGGAPGRWLLLDGGIVVDRGDRSAGLPAASRAILAVPGDQVAVHWLDLDEGLAAAQAAAAARLMLADASAEPLSAIHVAVGRPERGRTPAAIVPNSLMADWLAAAAATGVDPDSIVPAPLLLPAPESGFLRRDQGDVADYRGPAAAFSLEPDLAEPLVAGAEVQLLDDAAFESRLGPIAAAPPLDLRQGAFARRRHWRVDRRRVRRIATFAITLALLTLAVQVATILGYTFAADRAQAEADSLSRATPRIGSDSGPGFGTVASVLFEAVRATPNAELARLDYRPDGSLVATVTTDTPATLSALQQRIEAGGLTVAPGPRSNAGGRAATELTVRPG